MCKGYDEAGIERYIFVATLDAKTSEVCAELDGKSFDRKDAKPGTNYPPMHPFCRSTTIADFGKDTLKGLERRAKDENGNTIRIPANMTYDEWYKQNVSEKERLPLDNSRESGIITVGNAMAEATNSQISLKIEFADEPIEDPEGVEKARTFIQANLGISNPNLKFLKNAEVMQPFLEELSVMKQKYGKMFSHIEVFDCTPENRTLAETVNGTLKLNSRFFNDRKATDSLLTYWEKTLLIIPKGDNSISYIARHEFGHLLTQYQIGSNSKIITIISRSLSKGVRMLSNNPLQYYDGKTYSIKFYHEFCADLFGASKLDAKQLALKNKLLEVIT